MSDADGIADVADVPQAELLEALANATDGSIWLFTADCEDVVYVGDASGDVLGQPVDQLEADPTAFLDGIHPDDRDDLRELLAAAGTGEMGELDVRVDTEGTDRWLQIQARPIRDDGDVTHVVGFSREITERKRRERELERLEAELAASKEELQQFAYIASHDLQEPLRMVRSYVDLLEAELADDVDDETREYMEFAVDGAERMKSLIEGLLQFSRVKTRGDEFQEVETEQLLTEVRQALHLQIAETDATVSVKSLPTVTADRDQLSEVFQNLLDNALRYSGDDSPSIDVRGDECGDEFVFAVEDGGIGIPEDKQDDVFELFERGVESDGNGPGIGLTISRRIVERHGGEMWIESSAGEGTTVYFSLPKAPEVTDRESD